ncbi:MAG: putative manganese transporter [Patescibacteria group bacterium]|nr:putative manganese transporter [Patescibacteria group bacterium]
MLEIFFDALIDSFKMIPWLLVIYIGIELIEYKLGNKIREKVQKSGSAGPLIGSIAGSVPQCGFSVVATALYTQRLATIGTLIAVYLSTSDEAIPIILSEPDKIGVILPLLLTKIIIALIAGYGIDFIFRKKNKKTLEHIHAFAEGEDDKHHNHTQVLNEEACCGHSTSSSASKFKFKELFLHPLIHTLKIFSFIFLATLLINLLVFWLGQDAFYGLFTGNIIFQPFLAAIVGLIPNCAASVFITELYLKGVITYGSVIAGLCASGGLGILVLLKEEKDKKAVFIILGLLFGVSVLAGLIIQYLVKI